MRRRYLVHAWVLAVAALLAMAFPAPLPGVTTIGDRTHCPPAGILWTCLK